MALSDVLSQIPGYAGYQASRLRNQQQEQADIQQVGGLQNILAQAQKAQMEQQTQQALAKSGGDPEIAMGELIKVGNIQGAHALAPIAKIAAERKQSEQTAAGLRAVVGGEPAAPQQLGAGLPTAAPAGETPATPANPRESRIKQLDDLSILYAKNPVVVQRIQAERDRLVAAGDKMPQKRDRIAGDTLIQEEYVNGRWNEIGRGPRFSREAAPATKGDFTKSGDDFLSTLPETDRALIKKIANYEIDPKTLSTRGGQRERILSLASQYSPSFDQKNYGMVNNAMNRFATGPQGNTVRSLNVAIEHMDTARRLGDALQNNDIPIINRIANEYATQTGRPAPTNFNAVKEIVADEVVKGVIGNSGALQDRDAAAKKIRDTSSPEQLKGVLDSWTELMAGQLKGLEKQYEGATLGKKDFRDRYMTPRARAALEGSGKPAYVETRKTADGRVLGKKADGTIEEVKP